MTRPTGVLAIAAVATGVALAGCGTGSTAAATGTGSSTRSAGVTAAPDTSATADTTASRTTGTVASACQASRLSTGFTDDTQIRDGALAGMSRVDTVVMFTNDGGSRCRLQGYPGVALLGPKGNQIFQAVRTGATPRPVVLAPGQHASALVAANSASCADPTALSGLLVTAPDQRNSTKLTYTASLCPTSATVGALVPGDSGGTPY